MKKTMVMMVAVMFLFVSTFSVMGKTCSDPNSPKVSCSKEKNSCESKKKCDKKEKKGCCTKDKKKCSDPNSTAGK